MSVMCQGTWMQMESNAFTKSTINLEMFVVSMQKQNTKNKYLQLPMSVKNVSALSAMMSVQSCQ